MDSKTFIKTLRLYMSHPVIKLFLTPLTFMLYGIVFGSRIGEFHLLGVIVLYIFMLTMQFVEQYLFVNDAKKGYIKWQPLYLFEGILFILLALLLFMTNIIFVFLALVYVVGTHLIYVPFRLKGTVYYLVVQVFFKGFVVSVLASFLQARLISLDLLLAIVPILFVLLAYYSKFEKLDNQKYGLSALSDELLRITSLVGLGGMLVAPIVLGKLGIHNVVLLLLMAIVTFLFSRVILSKHNTTKSGKTKNYLSSLLFFYIVLYCFL